ncbi:MAG: histidine phosphatase family protein [Cyanobacteria bacterium P01_G01_bin.4]
MGPSVRVAIVRHGESTYNLERRFQGLLDRAVLTERGRRQAVCTGQALQDLSFDFVCSSPLQRARQTADAIVTELNGAGQSVAVQSSPLLKEIALYNWEGMTFDEIREQYPDDFALWRQQPHQLQMGDRYPLRDLWQQATEFWQWLSSQPLQREDGQFPTVLIVAHSGINRALVGTALGLEALTFQQFGMNNCSISILNFLNGLDERAQIESLNLTNHVGDCLPPSKGGMRLLLVRHGETQWNKEKRFQGQRDIPLNPTGEEQGRLAGQFLQQQTLDIAFSSPLKRPWKTAEFILQSNTSAQAIDPPLGLIPIDDLQEISHGLWEGLLDSEIEAQFPGELAVWQATPSVVQMPEGENLTQVWERSFTAWQQLVHQTAAVGDTATGLVVAHDAVNKAILCKLLNLAPEAFWYFKQGNGAVSAIDYPDGPAGLPVLRALNITSHQGGVIDCTAAGAL